MRRLIATFALLPAFLLPGARSDYLSIKQKFDQIEERKVKPGAQVPITSAEINEYVQRELPQVAPDGIRAPRVELLGDNRAKGYAKINFLKLRSARGQSSNWAMRKLLDGERDVAVTARLQSANGAATVYVDSVEVSGITLDGSALDFLIRNYLLPNYPNAKVGTPFQLKYGIQRLEVHPGKANVVMAAAR